MSFLFLSFFFFFFFTFTFKTNSTRIYKAKYDLLLSIIRLRGIPACSSLYPLLFELTEFTIDSFVLDDEMRHAEDDRFFLFSFSLFSLSLSHIYTHTYTFALSNSPSFVSSIQNETARRCNRTSEHVRRKRTIYRAHAREKTGSFTETFPKISRGKYTQSNRNFKRKNQGFGG